MMMPVGIRKKYDPQVDDVPTQISCKDLYGQIDP